MGHLRFFGRILLVSSIQDQPFHRRSFHRKLLIWPIVGVDVLVGPKFCFSFALLRVANCHFRLKMYSLCSEL